MRPKLLWNWRAASLGPLTDLNNPAVHRTTQPLWDFEHRVVECDEWIWNLKHEDWRPTTCLDQTEHVLTIDNTRNFSKRAQGQHWSIWRKICQMRFTSAKYFFSQFHWFQKINFQALWSQRRRSWNKRGQKNWIKTVESWRRGSRIGKISSRKNQMEKVGNL